MSSRNLELELKTTNCRETLQLKTVNFATDYGRRTFVYNGPRLWNALPEKARTASSIDTFKKTVKSILINDTAGFLRKAFFI